MKSKLFFPLAILMAFIISSCSDSQTSADATLKSIPKDVSMVTSIDADAILEKADFENVKQMAFFKKMISEVESSNATLAEVLKDPQSSGLDLSKNIYLAHHFDPNNPEEVFAGIVGVVKDKAAIEALIKSNSKFKISSHDGFDMATKGSQSVAWNEEKVVMGMTNAYSDPFENMQKFFTTTEETSIAGDANLKKAMSGNHDITSWFSSNALAQSASLKDALIMASIDADAIKDNFIHSYVDFNNGAIEGNSDLFLQSALMQDINLLFKDNVTTDFSSYVPVTASSVMAVAMDFEGVQQILAKRPQVSMMADFGLKEYGLSIKDISKTFGGDILVFSTPGDRDNTALNFATNINDTEILGKFLQLAVEYNFFNKVDDNLYTFNGSGLMANRGAPDAQILIQDDMLIISADPDVIAKISQGGYSGSEKIDKSKIKGMRNNILSGFMDYQGIIKSIPEAEGLDLKFQDLNYSTNRKNGNFKMNFTDKNANGLKQLFESINEIYKAENREQI